MRHKTVCLALSILVASPLVAETRAEAQPAAAGDVEKARELFQEGLALMAAQDFAGALVRFRAVSRVRMTAQVAFNIAECEEKLGNLVAALGNYRLALGKAQDPESPAPRVIEFAPARIAAIEPRIGKLKVERSEGRANPEAVIELDGVELGASQLGREISVDPGQRVLRVVVRGEIVSSQNVQVAEGASEFAKVVIPPPAQRVVDAPAPPLSEQAEGPSIPGIVLTVGGGALLVTGAIFVGLRQGAISELEDVCGTDATCPASAQSVYDDGRLYTGLAEVMIPTGVVATTLGIVLLSIAGGSDKAPESVGFFVPGDGPGFGISGSF